MANGKNQPLTRVIVTGNEKGGSGKSTTAMHIAVSAMRAGMRVACLDLDTRQGTIARYMENRAGFAGANNIDLPMPRMLSLAGDMPENEDRAEDEIATAIAGIDTDVLLIDTPGHDSPLARAGHSFADVLVTPLNDSFVDLDVLARVNPESEKVERPSHYAEMVWSQKMRRARRDGGSIDWIVMRNRLGHAQADNMKRVGAVIDELASRIGFRVIDGFSERVIFRELFLKGLTLMDILESAGPEPGMKGKGGVLGKNLSMSHIAARTEVRRLMDAIGS